MADFFEEVDKAETIVILILIGVGIYFLYEASQSAGCFINNLFGLPCDQNPNALGGGSYANAANQTITDPAGTITNILGIGGSYTNANGETVSGTAKIGASGQHYRCNTTQCYPISIDANGNETVSGVPVPIAQAN